MDLNHGAVMLDITDWADFGPAGGGVAGHPAPVWLQGLQPLL